jgi:hypothetical protein
VELSELTVSGLPRNATHGGVATFFRYAWLAGWLARACGGRGRGRGRSRSRGCELAGPGEGVQVAGVKQETSGSRAARGGDLTTQEEFC